MIGLAVVLDRAGAPAEGLAPVLRALSPVGDGGRIDKTVGDGGSLALGGDEHGWAATDDGDLLWLDGRIDNRAELAVRLGRSGTPEAAEDAALVLALVRRLGKGAWESLVGPWAVAWWRQRDRSLTLHCDPAGGRTLFYSLTPRRLIAASEAQAVLAHTTVPDDLDDDRLATFLALDEPTDNATFFRAVRQLLPGERLEIRGAKERLTRPLHLGDLSPLPTLPGGYGEAFRDRLDDAVESRVEPAGTGLLLSGGLDSSAVAAAAVARGYRPLAVSWVFDRQEGADERRYLEPLRRTLGLPAVEIPCDDELPLGDLATWPMHPATPEQNPYRRFHQLSYAAAAAQGAPVVLSGMLGDQLFSGTSRWLFDLWRRGRWSRAWGELLHHRAHLGTGWRRLAVGATPTRIRRPGGRRPPPWLTPWAAKRYDRRPPWPPEHRGALRPLQHLRLLGAIQSHGFSVERYYAGLQGVEVRYPYRDPRLLDLMLRVPTEELVSRGVPRPIQRAALAGRVPRELVERRDKATFATVFHEGLRESRSRIDGCLSRSHHIWSRFVRPEALETQTFGQDLQSLLIWSCVTLELWLESREVSIRADM